MQILKKVVGPLDTNCFILISGEEAAVIDPGDSASEILSFLSTLNVKLKYIILTHGHFDHTMAVPTIKEKTGATIVAHALEKEMLSSASLSNFQSFMRGAYHPIVADLFVEDNNTVTLGEDVLTFIHTPGHSEGSMCVQTENQLFTGDTLFAGECGRCDLFGGDYGKMLRSLKKLHDLSGDFVVYPGHMKESTLNTERKKNYYIQEALKL